MGPLDVARALAPPQLLAGWARRRLRASMRKAAARAAAAPLGPLASSVHAADLEGALASGSTAVVAHFDPDGEVAPYVVAHLEALRAAGLGVVLVSNSPLSPPAVAAVTGLAQVVVSRPNAGYDFGAWQAGVAMLPLDRVERLLLVNDSVYGPLRPLPPLLDRLTAEEADVWGLTESTVGGDHLQSYFLLLHRRALASAAFAGFWQGLRLVDHKASVVLTCELGLSRALRDGGLRLAAAFPTPKLLPLLPLQVERQQVGGLERRLRRRAAQAALDGTRPLNLTHQLWRELVEVFDFPYVKRELLRLNPTGQPGVDGWPELLDGQDGLLAAIEQDLRGHGARRP